MQTTNVTSAPNIKRSEIKKLEKPKASKNISGSKEVPAPKSILKANGKAPASSTVVTKSATVKTTAPVVALDSSSPINSKRNTIKAPAEITEYKLKDIGYHSFSELNYYIKNNSNKTIYTYKLVILLYDENNNSAFVRSSTNISDNMIQQTHHDYDIKPTIIKPGTVGVIESDKVKKVKIIISEIQYVGTSEIWVNPEINNIIQNRNKF
ncbi:hypothetical protein [Clostridium estertheticum]|uniref:Uncharacterized protein n=1 Tax=Clostridium estertheticum TaxID=238834 RepID=A0AA47I9A2_9CLOT|nr:hypothetical protein [Clostridium estertheticum]MBU3154023.1 hypothetical protein [Clostridium estertheticum]WAG62960.1 hypothetical protein LL038_12285 [Clostridium estertheticum]